VIWNELTTELEWIINRLLGFYESLFKEETAISLPSPDLGATSPELSIPSPPIELHTSSAEMESPSPITKPETPCSSRLQVGSETEERKVLLPEQNGNKQVIDWPSDLLIVDC
jgi:hypothetical protein